MSKEEIEDEIQARVAFKINEILTGCKNYAGRNWAQAFARNSAKHEHYWEAWKEFEEMVKKETTLPVPYDNMAKRNEWNFKESLVSEFKTFLHREQSGRIDSRQIDRMIHKVVAIVEAALRYRQP